LTNPQKQSLPFHVLKSSFIVQFLGKLGMQLTENELKDPSHHKEKVKMIFQQLIEPCMGVSLNNSKSVLPTVNKYQKSCPYPELHESSILEAKFLRNVKKFMKTCGIQDFGLRDLIAPASKRLRKQLSAAINFIEFREGRLSVYSELNDQRMELLDSLREVNDENTLVNKQYEDAKAVSSNKWKEIEIIENECADIKTEIAQQNKLQASIRHESGQLKKKAYEIRDESTTADLALQEALRKERKLAMKMVSSPKKIKKEMSDANNALEIENKLLRNAEKEVLLAKDNVNKMREAEESMSVAHKKIEEINVELSKHSEVKKETIKITELLNDNEDKIKIVNEKNKISASQFTQCENEKVDEKTRYESEMTVAHEALQFVIEHQSIVEKEKEDYKALVESNDAILNSMKIEIEEERLRADVEIADMIDAFKRFEAVILGKENATLSTINCA